MPTAKAEPWLIFIDTNVFLDFYRSAGESVKRQMGALERHKDSIILTDQVQMEFLKNRQKVIVEATKPLGKPNHLSLPAVVADIQSAKMMRKSIQGAEANFKKITAKIESIIREPARNDIVYQSVARLFEASSAISLKTSTKDRRNIHSKARQRFFLGYPPRKSADTSYGDAVNWEWIIHCATNSAKNHNILIVSRDGDYGVQLKDRAILNDWLRKEFKNRVSRKRKVELTNKLTDALKRLDEIVTAQDEADEAKVISEVNAATSRLRSRLLQVFGGSEGSKNSRLLDVLADYGPPDPEDYGPPDPEDYEPPDPEDYEPPDPEDYEPPDPEDYEPPDPEDYEPPDPEDYEPPDPEDYEPPDPEDYEPPDPEDYEPPDPEDYEPPDPEDYEPPDPEDYEPPDPEKGHSG